MLTTFYPPYAFGGDAIFVYRLTNALARRGHEVEVIHCLDSYRLLAQSDPSVGYENEPGVIIHGLSSWLGSLSPLATQQTGYPLFKRREIKRILSEGHFDVLHFHNISLIGGPMILRYGEGIKLYTMLEHWLVCPTHVLFKFNREACTEQKCLRCTLAHRRPPQLWRYTGMLRSALKHVDAFISPSEFTRQRHLAAGLDIPIVQIPYFLDESSPGAASSPLCEEIGIPSRPFFLFVGRLEKLKGVARGVTCFSPL